MAEGLSVVGLEEGAWDSTWHSRNGTNFSLIIGESARNVPPANPLNYAIRAWYCKHVLIGSGAAVFALCPR